MTAGVLPVLAGLVVLAGACRESRGEPARVSDSTLLAAREERLLSTLSSGDSASETPLARWVLPPALAEISGMTLTSDQRLLVHNDESARVFEVDYRRGVVLKSFQVGLQTIRDDFEAIATLADRMFLLASSGRIYEFREGENGSRVRHEVHDTGLGGECEFEGMAVDSAANAIVLACKNILVEDLDDVVVLYRIPLSDSTRGATRIVIPEREAIGSNDWKRFTPSDITVDPASGDYVVIAAQEKAVMLVAADGTVRWTRPLPEGHAMAEGVVVTRNGLLLVSDEAASREVPGSITVYRWR